MISNAVFNMGYNGSYMFLPLPKTKIENDTEFIVNAKKNDKCDEDMKSLMGNLNDIKRADFNNDGIISLNELRECDNKSEFMEHLIFELEQFEKKMKNF